LNYTCSIESRAHLCGASGELAVSLLELVGVDNFIYFVLVLGDDETDQHHDTEANERSNGLSERYF